ncbi:uncharacterized protein FOMMEDRAFT_138995 [Fomitiporia mediterranea MF3/22]|uniref:uncharacterized protein n=1 Tax=Fomitiporia mediterranea (strain MF3/22) TaxID=694068 RepID=UPI00044091CC|nr:uncharacterized protein FOMMEDRAFT_138995 [Fomitiporia mediterranea MF3/22]EJD05587.1 hypothetical protein FOMMEDRAFT_138995 [Fomitiporia mediterranea MF3/22]
MIQRAFVKPDSPGTQQSRSATASVPRQSPPCLVSTNKHGGSRSCASEPDLHTLTDLHSVVTALVVK